MFMYLCEQSYSSAQLWCWVEEELVLVWGVRPNDMGTKYRQN